MGVPDYHVRLDDGLMRLEGGPRENGHRPAIDPLFRSAAELTDGRTVGVILSGALDDGTRGLRTIKARGGTTIVQDPETALHPGMPTAAIRHVAPDRVLAPDEIASALAELSNETPRTRHNVQQRDDMSDRDQVAEQATDEQPGEETGLTCPECGGAIWQREDEGVVSFHCRVGHAYAADTFISEQSRTAEAALWAGLRLLEERAVLMRRLSERFAERPTTSTRFEQKADELEKQATELTHVLREVTGSATPEFATAED